MKRTPMEKRNLPNPSLITNPKILERIRPHQVPGTKTYRMGACIIYVSHSEKWGWHISISCKKRYPSWDEVAKATYDLLPQDGRYYGMLLPPEDDYINAGEYVFLIHEMVVRGDPKTWKELNE